MTVDEIKQRVSVIRDLALKREGPKAHAEEDALYADVLNAIAKGECAEPEACAAEAVSTQGIKFDRWTE